jgi:transposase-like protein
MRNALSQSHVTNKDQPHVTNKDQRPMVAAMIRTVFAQGRAKAASEQWRKVAGNLCPKFRKLAKLMDRAESDPSAFMAFPKEHWAKAGRQKGSKGR